MPNASRSACIAEGPGEICNLAAEFVGLDQQGFSLIGLHKAQALEYQQHRGVLKERASGYIEKLQEFSGMRAGAAFCNIVRNGKSGGT